MDDAAGGRRQWKGVVILNKPPIDKIAAAALVETTLGEEGEVATVYFWNHPACPDEQLAAWRAEGILPIDLGQEKYHHQGVGSATEYVARVLNINLGERPEVRRLIKLINENNRTGKLKGSHMSIAWLVRELYEIADYGYPEYTQEEVVARAKHVVHAFLVADKTAGGQTMPGKEEIQKLRAEFPELCGQTQICNFAPFTVGRYLRDLWRSGQYTSSQITIWVRWWLNAWDRVRRIMDAAEAEARTVSRYEFRAGGLRGRTINSDDKFVVRGASRLCDVLITRNSTGHVAILTRGLDVAELAGELEKREPELWHHGESAGQLVNGGLIYSGQPPTKLTLDELVKLVQTFPPRRRERARALAPAQAGQ